MKYAIDKQEGKVAECRFCDHVAFGATPFEAFERLAEHVQEEHKDAMTETAIPSELEPLDE